MDDTERPTGRITIWTRIVAGLFFLIVMVGALGTIIAIVRTGNHLPPIPWYKVAFVILFMMAFLPAVASVAFRGRLPKYWLDMERRGRARRRPQSISILWHWKPRVPRWLHRTFLTLWVCIPGVYATVITLNAITWGIDGRQLGLLIFAWLLAAVVMVSVVRWWRSPAWNADRKPE